MNPGRLVAYLALGLAQGLALYGLIGPDGVSPLHAHPVRLSALVHFTFAAPLVYYLLAGSLLRVRARAVVSVAIAALVSGLAAYTAATGSRWGGPFSFTLAVAALSYMLVVLAAGFETRRRWFDYELLFEHGWRNALLLGAAGALTGILWVLLLAAAFMLNALGVEALSRALKEPLVIATLSCTAYAFFMWQATVRGEALVALRKFWLTLNTWFLPLSLLLAIVWVGALLFTGPQPLFQTRRAALMLFWFVALAVLFMNAAYQDGRAAPYARPLARAATIAWLAIPVLAVVGLWALGLRVVQLGWTVDRLWAAVVGGMAFIYGAGYSASTLSRGRWMPSLENTNIAAALALAVAIVICTGPVADFRRIAVDDQLARLHSGRTPAAKFDVPALKRDGGKWGIEALQQLAADAGVAESIRSEAKMQLANGAPPSLRDQDPAESVAVLRRDVKVLPAGSAPSAQLLEFLARRNADWSEKECVRNAQRCVLWLVDLDGDGAMEAVLLRDEGQSVAAPVYAAGANGWSRVAALNGPSMKMADWLAAIEERKAQIVKPAWPDLQVGGKRYWVRPN
jgi:hypothetical protein